MMDSLSAILLILNLFLSCNAAVLSTPGIIAIGTTIPVTTASSPSPSYTTAATVSPITGLLSSVTPIFPTTPVFSSSLKSTSSNYAASQNSNPTSSYNTIESFKVYPLTSTAMATACIPATIVTDGYSVFGYETAAPSPEQTNYYPAQGFFDSWFIGGNTMHFPISDRARVEWQCQYSCGSRCLAFFVFWGKNNSP